MIIKKVLTVLTMTALLTGCAACSADREGQGPVSIYVADDDYSTNSAVMQYNEIHKDNPIKVKKFYNDQYDVYVNSLKKELASGKGPDIIVADTVLFPNLSKFIDSGCFSPLDDVVKQDKSFRMGDYNKKVLDYGIYGGKRFLIPLYYTIDSLFTTKEILENNIEAHSGVSSLKGITEAALKYMDENKGKDRYFLSNLNFNTIIQNSSELYIDMANKTAKFDSNKFKGLLKAYKTIYPAICPANKRQELNKSGDTSASLKDGNVIFLNVSAGGPQTLWGSYGAYTAEVDPVIFPVPSADKVMHTPITVNRFAAINSKCKNKKAAFEFIKLLMSVNFQASGGLLFNIPVNNQAYDILKNNVLKNENNPNDPLGPRGGGCQTDATAKKLVEQLDHMIAGIGKNNIIDDEISKIIGSDLQEFLNGRKTADEAAKSIQKKVDSYFDEKLDAAEYNVTEKERTGDYEGSSNTKTRVNTKGGPDKIKADYSIKATLKLYYTEYNAFIDNAIRVCKDKYPGLKFNITKTDNYDEFQNKLATKIMAGEGPDVVIFYNNVFNSIHKAALSGVFCDLNPLISDDKEFRISDYNTNVLDCGVFNGKRYLIPLNYNFDILYTTPKAMEENDIKIDRSNWTISGLKNTIQSFLKNKKPAACFFGYGMNLIALLKNSGIKLMDYKTGKTYFQSNEFIELLNIYKEYISPATMTREISKKYKHDTDMLKDKAAVIFADIGGNTCTAGGLFAIGSILKSELGDERFNLYTFPSWDGKGGAKATPLTFAAINAKCRDRKAAFAFIKMLLSKELQRGTDSYGNSNDMLGNPVNKEAWKEDMDYVMSDNARMNVTYAPSPAFVKKLEAQLDQIVSTAQAQEIFDNEVYRIINDELQYFLNGKKTAEQIAKILDEKVGVYLNE